MSRRRRAPRAWIVDSSRTDAGPAVLRLRYRRERLAEGGVDELDCTMIDTPDVVAGVVHDPAAGLVVLVRQVRPGPLLAAERGFAGPCCLDEIVAGVLDPGTAPAAMIAQEVREETGLEPLAVAPLAVAFTNPALSAARAHFFLVAADSRRIAARPTAGLGRADEQEDIGVTLLPAAELGSWIARGRIVDTLSLTGLLLAAPRI